METTRGLTVAYQEKFVKIVLLADSLHSIAAGSERQIYKLAEGLVNSGHQVRLILLRNTTFTLGQQFNFPCAVQVLGITSLLSWNAVQVMSKLRAQLAEEHTEVVHAYFPDSCLVAPLFLGSSEYKIVTSRRDMGLIYKGKPAWLFRALASRVDLVISNSSAVAQLIAKKEGIHPEKSCVIYNGIEDYTANLSQPEQIFRQPDSIKLILVANVKPVKRTFDAVLAVEKLIASGYKVELALAGEKQDNTYVAHIEQYVSQNKRLADCIYWLGQVEEPRRLLALADIGILISESEGLSNTIMEYMQAGLPVIATNVGGNPELVADGFNGLLIEKGDVESLVNAILILGQHQILKSEYGENGKLRIYQDFSISAMIAKHENAYRRN